MKTILELIEAAGGLGKQPHISIENPPWMRLVVEILPESGPSGQPVISVAHYGVQNGDLMRDPEMLFEVVREGVVATLWPFYFRNDYVGVEQWSRRRDSSGNMICRPALTREFEEFAELWDANLAAQGYLQAYLNAAV
ncbi:MAG: hypothetical protein LC114_17200 [Bryobacterales bacterium]|nr:hypothetical protein [Bryobacterales bacterium]